MVFSQVNFGTQGNFMELKRSVGRFGLLLFAVGGIVGSGWLFGPFFAAKLAGPAAILAWCLGGFLMMFIALTFSELAAMYPVAGGSIRFLQISHGTLVSFTFAWIGWISSVAVAPIETLALLQYASHYLPWLMYVKNGAHLLTGQGMIVAAFLMGVMCFINIIGVKILSKSNSLLVSFKLLIPIITLVILLAVDFHPGNFTLHGFAPEGFQGILSALPAAGIIFSFIGYSPAIQLAGETKDPQSAIPFAIIGALLICIVLYFLLQTSFIGALTPESFAKGWTHLHFAGDAGPFIGLMTFIGFAWFVKILYLDAFVSPFGTGLIYSGSTARMAYAMGKNGYMPNFFMKINVLGVPGRLILLNYFLGLLLFLPFPTWQTMMSFLVSALVFAYAVGPLALVVLRKIEPEKARPFRLPKAKLMAFLAFYVCNLILLWTGWAVVSKMLIAVIVGYAVLIIYRRYDNPENKLPMEWHNCFWLFAYLALIAIVSYCSTFGDGHGYIKFGWDFLAVLIESLIIFFWSYASGCKTPAQEINI